MQYIKELDGLRGLAVTSVVIHHASPTILPGGFIGVDIFFVLSGFLIARIIQTEMAEGRFSLLSFWERRARRILPALVLVITTCLLAGTMIFLPQDLHRLGDSAAYATGFMANVHFLFETDYFMAPRESYPLLHLWSLGVEEQFYLILPLLFLAALQMRKGALLPMIASLSVLSFAVSVWAVSAYPKGAFYLLPTRFWELGLGVCLALLPQGRWRGPAAQITGLAGLSMIVIAAVSLTESTPFPGIAALLPTLGAALLIRAGSATLSAWMLSWRPLVWIGLISYSLYLWHWPVLSFAQYVQIDVLSPAQTTWAVVLSVILATLTYRWVETPFRRQTLARPAVLTASAASLASVLALAGVISLYQGFPSRLANQTHDIFRMAYLTPQDDISPCQPLGLPLSPAFHQTCGVGADPMRPDFVIWGDSHAHALRAGAVRLSQMTKGSGLVISKNACMGLMGATSPRMPFWHQCDQHNQAVLDYLERVQPKTVILASRWTWEGYQLPSTGAGLLSAEASDQGLTRSLGDTTDRIRNAGVGQVILLGNAPDQPWNVPAAMARARHWDRPLPARSLLSDHRQTNALLKEAAAHVSELVTLWPASALCDDDTCAYEKDGWPLYSDDNHLSPLGAQIVGEELGRMLQ